MAKFYKRQNMDYTNPRTNKLAVEITGEIVTDTSAGMQTPRGDAASRIENPVNGTIRYNTEIGPGGELEAYINGTWEIIKTNRQAIVTQQEFDNGDYQDTIFGPLAYNIDIDKPQNLVVYVENVYQLPEINYTLVRSTEIAPLTTSTTVVAAAGFGATVIQLESIADFNVGLTLTGTNLQNNTIVATSATDKTITIDPGALGFIPEGGLAVAIYSTGTYVKFATNATPVPFKPVITFLGLDGYCPPFQV
jgi:3D (Asp-Asp-Asp) domain-containing protein